MTDQFGFQAQKDLSKKPHETMESVVAPKSHFFLSPLWSGEPLLQTRHPQFVNLSRLESVRAGPTKKYRTMISSAMNVGHDGEPGGRDRPSTDMWNHSVRRRLQEQFREL